MCFLAQICIFGSRDAGFGIRVAGISFRDRVSGELRVGQRVLLRVKIWLRVRVRVRVKANL